MIENLSTETQNMFQKLTASIKEQAEYEQYDENNKIYPSAIGCAFFHGESWYRCPHCSNSFEFWKARHNWGVADHVYRCPECKKLFSM